MFWSKKPEEPTQADVIDCANRYFYKYYAGLTAGTIKADMGPIVITVNFQSKGQKEEYVK